MYTAAIQPYPKGAALLVRHEGVWMEATFMYANLWYCLVNIPPPVGIRAINAEFTRLLREDLFASGLDVQRIENV